MKTKRISGKVCTAVVAGIVVLSLVSTSVTVSAEEYVPDLYQEENSDTRASDMLNDDLPITDAVVANEGNNKGLAVENSPMDDTSVTESAGVEIEVGEMYIDSEDQIEALQAGNNGNFGNIKWTYNEKTGELKISGSANSQYDWERGFEYYDEVPWATLGFTRLTISSGIMCIPEGVFSDCSSLRVLTCPDTAFIFGGAFAGCENLKEVTLPCTMWGGKIPVYDYDFGDEWEIMDLISWAFEGCPLETIKVTSGKDGTVTAVGNILFNKDKSALILYPGGKTSETYQIPDSVKYVADGAFVGNKYLRTIRFGKNFSADGIGSYNNALEGFAVHPDNESYSAPGGVLYTKDKGILITYPVGKSGIEYITNSDCVRISYRAFFGSGLKEIKLTNNVTTLDKDCFWGCESLEKLTIPVAVTNIDQNSFAKGYVWIPGKWVDGEWIAGEDHYIPLGLTDIYYTGTEEQWNAINGIQEAMSVFGENVPAIHYGSEEVTPSDEEEAPYYADGDEPGEDVTGLTSWEESATLNDGTEISARLYYTESTTYDGRKHVLSVNPAKNDLPIKASVSVNPDIVVKNFAVFVDGAKAEGIKLKSIACKNNVNPGEMQLVPSVTYGSDAVTKQLLSSHKDLKKALTAMFGPKKNKEGEWTTTPILVKIDQIELSSSMELYNLKGMSKAEQADLAKKDGVLVWNGTKETITFGKRTEKEEDYDENDRIKWITYTYFIPTKVVVPGLYYQRVFDLGGGVTKVKKINLRAGSWSLKSKTYSEDGDKWTDRWAEIASKSFDYVAPEPDAEGGYEKDEKPTYIQPILNTDGYTTTRTKKVTYREDGETWTDYEDYEVVLATPGFFKGSLPSFETE